MKPSESNSEWLTRKRLIDPKLKAAGEAKKRIPVRHELAPLEAC
ncbi:MAG: hypothetical protein WB755_24665 [Terriglobales bacterium]